MSQNPKQPISDSEFAQVVGEFEKPLPGEAEGKSFDDSQKAALRAAIDKPVEPRPESEYPVYARKGNVGMHPMPEQMSQALEGALAKDAQLGGKYAELSEGQRQFLRSWIFAAASYATELGEERRRLSGGGLPIRTAPKMSSFVFSNEAESRLYGGILNGGMSAEIARQQMQPQDIVLTTHPNFSQKTELARLTPKVIKALSGLSNEDFVEMARGGESAQAVVAKLLGNRQFQKDMAEAMEHLKPRTQRNRAAELDEATLELIPRAYEGNTEEVAIMLKRARMVGVKLEGKQGAREINQDVSLSFEQVQALASLTSNYSTWFTDGDGKRTSHAWDNEYAIPAIKAASMERFIKDLQELKSDVSHLPVAEEVDQVVGKLQKNLERVEAVRDAARERMLALTRLQSYADEHGSGQTRDEVTDMQGTLREAAQKAGMKYRALIMDEDVRSALLSNASDQVLAVAKQLKEAVGRGEVRFPKITSHFDEATPLSKLDGLIIRASKGDFPMKIERRENANQHKYAVRYFLEALSNAGHFKKLVALNVPGTQPPQHLTENDLKGAMRATTPGDEDRLRIVLEAIDDLAARSHKNPSSLSATETELLEVLRSTLENSYKTTRYNIEPNYEHVPDAMPMELERHKSVFLDDVSPFFLSGKLYGDAFKRVIIAEAGSPANTMLAQGVQDKIRKEAVLRDSNDVLTANVFKNLLGSKVDVVPLYEDPDAILHTPSMLANKLRKPVYYDALGIDFSKAPERTLKHMDGKEISAYDFMHAQGYSDAQMTARNLNIADLKEAMVYVGPHKMLANSDSAKRGTLAASTLNQISLVECYEAAARNLVKSDDGKKYMYVNQIYLGQGGALARTTGTDAMVNTITEQGQHPTFTTGSYSAMKSVLRAVSRLVLRNANYENGLGGVEDVHKLRIAKDTMALGNPYAFRMDVDSMQQLKQAALKAIRVRIRGTRDDIKVPANGNGGDSEEVSTRYEEMLKKYGEDFIANYSARPAAKGSKPDFVGIRAIGLAGKEFGFFSNIVGVSEMFDFKSDGHLSNLNLMAKLYTSDPSVKHNFDAAAYTANLAHKTMPLVWKKGGVEMSVNAAGDIELTKEGQTAKLSDVAAAYRANELSFNNFDAADLSLANVHQQTVNFVSGLKQIRDAVSEKLSRKSPLRAGDTIDDFEPVPVVKVKDPIELIPEHLRATVEHARELAGGLAQYFREMEAKPGVVKNMKQHAEDPEKMSADARSLRMAKDAYYQLMETSLEQQALSRVPYLGVGRG